MGGTVLSEVQENQRPTIWFGFKPLRFFKLHFSFLEIYLYLTHQRSGEEVENE
jgi:hypothetical protein